MKDDAELLRSYVEDCSEKAFAELVRRHLGLVYSGALRRVGHDMHLAEDIAQKVFSDLARKAPSLAGRASIAGWLYVSTHLAAAEVVHKERRRKARENEALTGLTHLRGQRRPGCCLVAALNAEMVRTLNSDRPSSRLREFGFAQ
jgi:DNA-directed RNA polymerase specialized sigma24 family protein